MREKCLAQEHNTVTLARPRTQTACFGIESSNHEVSLPPKSEDLLSLVMQIVFLSENGFYYEIVLSQGRILYGLLSLACAVLVTGLEADLLSLLNKF